MKIELSKREENGVRIVEDICPDGWIVIDTYHPCGSVTPWDYHGGKHQREYRKVLNAAGIESLALEKRKTLLHPVGTGPGGSVRMGDNMTPHTYYIAVKKGNEGKAAQAFNEHKAAIRRWLDDGEPMPEACR